MSNPVRRLVDAKNSGNSTGFAIVASQCSPWLGMTLPVDCDLLSENCHAAYPWIEKRPQLRQISRVKRAFCLILMVAAGAMAGCNNSSPPAVAVDPNSTDAEPTQAQPKLPTMKIYLGAETLDAELAVTPKEEQTGMMFRTNIQETDAMIFPLPVPMRASFWMENCPESISAAYITPDGVIQEIHHLEKNDTNIVYAARDDIKFVLETREGWFTRHNIGVGTVIQSEKGPLIEAVKYAP